MWVTAAMSTVTAHRKPRAFQSTVAALPERGAHTAGGQAPALLRDLSPPLQQSRLTPSKPHDRRSLGLRDHRSTPRTGVDGTERNEKAREYFKLENLNCGRQARWSLKPGARSPVHPMLLIPSIYTRKVPWNHTSLSTSQEQNGKDSSSHEVWFLQH